MFDFHDGKTIYMEQPPYHEVINCLHYVVKLCKSLYGLKQARRKWYDMLSGLLVAIGIQKSAANPAVFFIHIGSDMVILFIHVDDTTMTGSSVDLIKRYEQ